MTTTLNQVELFGGAITANIPDNFADVSKIRQVPDNQEVYLDKNGFTSLTFDITERVSHLPTDKEALEYHLADIVAETDTQKISSLVENVALPNLPSTIPVLALTANAKQSVSALAVKALAPGHTDIHFTLIRLVEQSTDIAITLNIPYLNEAADDQVSNGTEARKTQQEMEQEAWNMYHRIVTSFAIKDWGLFGS